MIIDTHVHYDDEAFDGDREELLASLRANGLSCVLDIGSSADSLPKVRALAQKYDFIYGAVGLHPDEVGDLTEEVIASLREDMKNPKIVAVGEIGLDYHYPTPDREMQRAVVFFRCVYEGGEVYLEKKDGEWTIFSGRLTWIE